MAIFLLGLNSLSAMQAYAGFGWLVLLFFILLTMGLFFAGRKLSMSRDINAYTRMILLFLGLKMFLCIMLVLTYYNLAKPEGKTFLLPFFLIYLTFTIFEVIITSRLGRNNANNGIKQI